LNYENNIKQDIDKKTSINWYPWERIINHKAVKYVNNQVDEKVSKEPGDVINPDVHACYKH
jgi:hypothetical protein